ncbi:MAG: DNA mismatch repair endonuclease MutL [Eubacteriales bacterium]|nr:DNA mismatch repair endonuclease MutL [Eubacteriales bacterium]
MAEIHVLDKDTINQIAAGEVVERPASIVKELVENALDALSTAVTIEIKGGGIDFIRITDNGSGIEKEQVKKAFLRHATSKISSARDLETVGSLGFRGEALSSIAAVAKVELITKTGEGISGVRYVIEGGEEIAFEEIGCPEGTTFVIRNLFYNTPARRKFLKSAMTEAGYVEAFVQRLALSHPAVSFKFICDNKNKISTSGNGNLKDVIYHIFGRDIAMNLLEVHSKEGGVSIEGYIGKPVISRGNRNYENYFVNGRYLKNTIISRGIEDGYKGHAMVHKFPFTALMIEMDSRYFDVNVHPAKMEMRFNNGEELYTAMVSAIKNSFIKKELIPSVSLEKRRASTPDIKKDVPEPFEKKRKQIEDHFAHLSREKLAEIESRKQEDSGEPEAEKPASSVSIAEKIARLNVGSLSHVKQEIDRAMPEKQVTEKNEKPDVPVLRDSHGQKEERESEKTNASFSSFQGEQMELSDIPLLSREARPRHRLIGQVFQTYWMVEYEDKLFFVDQHAAHEKVMYERLKKNLEEKTVQQQMVAPPIILTFSMKERERFLQFADAFAALGYLIEEFGGEDYCVRAVPSNLYGLNQQDLFFEMLDRLDENSSRLPLDMITDKLASMACKAAVKGNQKLSFQEMDSLMEQLLELENPYQCPHGRPTIISMTKYELEKKFKRVQ